MHEFEQTNQLKLQSLWVVAMAEMRSCRRLIRTWVAAALATFFCIAQWISLNQHYANSSDDAPIVGLFGPRYLLSQMAQPIVICFAVGIVFLAFDIRARDIRDRIVEALEARPISNLHLLSGRLIGIVVLLAIPAALTIGFIAVWGALAELFSFEFGSAIEPVSVVAFLVWDILPNLAFWGSLTILLATVLRFRLLVVVAMLGLMFIYYTLGEATPLYLASALSTYTGAAIFPSELAPQFASWDIVLNRLTLLALSASFLVLSAGLHARIARPTLRNLYLSTGVGVLLLSAVSIMGLMLAKESDLRQQERWASIHKENRSHYETNVEAVSGTVEIRPGRTINLDLTLTMASSGESSTNEWLFSLNPGYQLSLVEIDGETAEDYEFEDGLLRINTTNTISPTSELHLVARGTPNPLFAYLDSPLDWKTMEPARASKLFLQGQKSYIFHSQFVALMPGVSWFPVAGAAFGRHVLETHKIDFFDLDINVVVPEHWTVAGPGSSTKVVENNTARYRFNPKNPIPELALIGSKFARRAFEIGGIEFEVLLSSKHKTNLDVFQKAVPALKDWTGEQVDQLQAVGLNYPFGTLSFVEVPVSLRVYEGGWSMGTAFTPPGLQLIRESGFPIAEFEKALAQAEDEYEGDEEAIGQFLFGLLRYYFQNDLYGGSPILGLGKQVLGYQTAPHGEGATALLYILNDLASDLAAEGDALFSIHFMQVHGFTEGMFTTSSPNEWFAQNFIDLTRGGQIERPQVWDFLLANSLASTDFDAHPKLALESLMIKSLGITRSMFDTMPREQIGSFLHRLLQKYRGKTYSQEEFFQTAMESGINFELFLGDWLNSNALPGFVYSDLHAEEIRNDDADNSIFQTSFTVRNDQSVPGVLGIEYELKHETPGPRREHQSDPIHVAGNSALRVAVHTSSPIDTLTLIPRLALNREELRWSVPLWQVVDSTTPLVPPVTGLDWEPSPDEFIVVDDLDRGFTISNGRTYSIEHKKPPLFAYVFGPDLLEHHLDHGLPRQRTASRYIGRPEYLQWYREREYTSHGAYYRTFVSHPNYDGQSKPTFTAELPLAGTWMVEFHVPALTPWHLDYPIAERQGFITSYWPTPQSLGLHRFVIDLGSEQFSAELDLENPTAGWNSLGTFETTSGKVDVVVDQVENGVAMADAVRWSPVKTLE